MVVQCDGFRLNRRTMYRVYCSECHRYLGDISSQELQHLMTGQYGKVICFDCEARWVELFGFGPNGPEVVVE
jgi:RNase P subunit RPR2